MSTSKKVLVIGGSLGGLFAANLLLRKGFDVHVYERVAEELEGRGAGIVTHPELLQALEAAGIAVDDSIGVQVSTRVTLDSNGQCIATQERSQTLTAWGRLFHVLRSAFPSERYHNAMVLTSIEQEPETVTACFADGSRVTADLLVAADGLRSCVRQALLPQAKPQYAGYIAWRGLVDESALSDAVLKDLFPYFAFGLPAHEQMIAYPVAGKNNSVGPGQRRFNFVWYRPADEATTLTAMLTDASGKVWADGIPPPLVRPEVLADAKAAARKVLAPQFAEVVEKTEGLFFQPIFDLESEQLAFGRVALLGDAAFVARPHCGMGVTKAAGDAVALADALATNDDIASALRIYEGARMQLGSQVVGHARDLGAYMQAQILTPKEREMAERYRTVEAVMKETAVPFMAPH
ncbi:FAD-dependent oxidoreductase [Comamonas sp. Tr-654]|uniref:FAD binding domain-containing protein n=1 Tax=Comamonas sp. Tr-654 TaxID=2608341 RepID=UPI001423FAB9|nr:FAD binding domain-containing protein [Comamonas sp. Tr-654]NIF85796.1 FAD-dependent oxidoreductase [Comamonas sp. Tr-654]